MNACYNNRRNVYNHTQRREVRPYTEKNVSFFALLISIMEAILSNSAIVSVMKAVCGIACVGFFALTVGMVVSGALSILAGALICIVLFGAVAFIFAN
jgi:uncharacterized membrane protein